MLLKLEKLQANSSVLTVADSQIFAQILFSFDDPVGILYKDVMGDYYGVLTPEQRIRRTMTTHLDHWIPRTGVKKLLTADQLNDGLRRLFRKIDPPVAKEEEKIPSGTSVQEKDGTMRPLHGGSGGQELYEKPSTELVETVGLDKSNECPVCFEPLSSCVCPK